MKHFKFIFCWVLVLIILGLSFYWYELRSIKIRKECDKQIVNLLKNIKEDVDFEGNYDGVELLYKTCIRAKGLKE